MFSPEWAFLVKGRSGLTFLYMAEEAQKLNADLDEIVQEESFDESEIKLLREMAEKGIMYGHKKNRTNPKFKPYIFATRNGLEIIDLGKTVKGLETAIEFLKKQLSENKTVLLIGMQPASWESMGELAKKYNFSMAKNGWIGGLLTNFKNVSQRIEYFKKLRDGMAKGEFEKYTKKERVMISKNIEKMKLMFEGLENLVKIPDVVFVIDTALKSHVTAIKEAKLLNIPVIAVMDSDDDPERAKYVIPANDHSKLSIDWIMEKIGQELSSVKISENINKPQSTDSGK